MENITLKRTGKPSLTFQGERLINSDGHWCRGKEHNRWHEITIYRAEDGRYVVHIQFCTQWQGELERSYVFVTNKPADVLTAFDPAEHLQGFPPLQQYAERQANLKADIRSRYSAQVDEVLDGIGIEEELSPESDLDESCALKNIATADLIRELQLRGVDVQPFVD